MSYADIGYKAGTYAVIQSSLLLNVTAITASKFCIGLPILHVITLLARQCMHQFQLCRAKDKEVIKGLQQKIISFNAAIKNSVKAIFSISLYAVPLIKLAETVPLLTQRLSPIFCAALVGRVWVGFVAIKSIYDIAMLSFYLLKLCLCCQDANKKKICCSQIRSLAIDLFNNARTMLYTAIFAIPIIGLPIILFGIPERAGDAFGAVLGSFEIFNKLAHAVVYPLGPGILYDDAYKKTLLQSSLRAASLEENKKNRVQLHTKDGRILDAIWDRVSDKDDAPTAILFHGNLMLGADFRSSRFSAFGGKSLTAVFNELGINTLCVTVGGYPGTIKQDGPTTELTAMKDAEAAVKWVRALGAKKIVALGHSIGGHQAFCAASFDPEVHVIASNTLGSIRSVASRFARDIFAEMGKLTPMEPLWMNKVYVFFTKGMVPVFSRLIQGIAQGIISTVFRPGITDDGVHYTNGFNNAEKAKLMKGKLFVLCSSKDDIMGDFFENRYDPFEQAPVVNLQENNCESQNIVAAYNEGHTAAPIETNRTVSDHLEHSHNLSFWADWPQNRAIVEKYLTHIGMIPQRE